MSRLTSMLHQRFNQDASGSKMAQHAQKASTQRTSAHSAQETSLKSLESVFASCELTGQEKASIKEILDQYKSSSASSAQDYSQLCTLTVEIKAITKQAILLHGERIQKAQTLLKGYKEGAFSAWLVQAYGNRQTPYNLLLYYEFFHQLQPKLRAKLELIPRQAAYTLASRKGALEDKIELIENYKGETKSQMLELIRYRFPLAASDARKGSHPALGHLRLALRALNQPKGLRMSASDLASALQILKACQKLLVSK